MEFRNLFSIFESNRVFVIPDYQREYSWEKKQIETIWEDIRALMPEPGCRIEPKTHFLGALVTMAYDKDACHDLSYKPERYGIPAEQACLVLDGQQRLTTINLLFWAISEIVSKDEELSDMERGSITGRIEPTLYAYYQDVSGNKAPSLFLKGNSGKYYNKRFLGAEFTTDNRLRSIRRINNTFDFFTKQIIEYRKERAEHGESHAAYYESFISVLRNFNVVEIRCQSNMDAFQVFESLNGKGLDLNAIDRIKNLYMSNISQIPGSKPLDSWNEIVKNICDEAAMDDNNRLAHFFVSFFFARSRKRISRSSLPDQFLQVIKEYKESGGFEEFNKVLHEDSDTYGRIRKGAPACQQARAVLKQVAEIGQEQIYVPLFAAAKYYGINSDGFVQIAQELVSYMVRHTICGTPTNRLDSEFRGIIERMEMGLAEPGVVMDRIRQKKENDEEFIEQFAAYETKDATFARYLLTRIEQRLKLQESGDESLAPEDSTLEHVIPQKANYTTWFALAPLAMPSQERLDDYDDVIYSIGNMILLKKNDNSKANNKDYLSKVEIYRNGSNSVEGFGKPYGTFKLVQQLVDTYPIFFGEDQVRDRAKSLAKIAVTIW